MDESRNEPSRSSTPANEDMFPRAHRLMRRLTWLYASVVLAVGVWLALGLLPADIYLFGYVFGVSPEAHALAREWIDGGLGAIVFPSLLLALTVSLATLVLTGARFRYGTAAEAQLPETRRRSKLTLFFSWLWSKTAETTAARCRRLMSNPGFTARQGQAIIVTTGAILIWIAERLLWPGQPSPPLEAAANVGIGVTFVLAFLSLMAERVINAFPQPQLQEAPTVRRLLFFTTLMLVAAACLEIGRSMDVMWVRWLIWVLACLPGLVVFELTLRALARLFLPPPLPADATAVTDSLVVALITGGPRAPGAILRSQLGLDFSRSWAVSFLSKALLPAAFGTGLLCWGLSGVKLIDLDQRGVYERLGAPVAVLGPGLHVLLPWPLGRLRPVDFGGIHSVAIGVDQEEPDEMVLVDSEAPAPLSLNRLWESSHAGQAHYLVPSVGTGLQSFQSIATEISVLYRVGLSDSAALESVYAVADPKLLVRSEADRLVLRFFNSQTLEAVIGARRENVAGMLRDQLAASVDTHHAGIEIVSVLIEEIHPPVALAAAYHAVQAAEIKATATVFDETAKATLTAGEAQQQAHQMITAADANAAETRHKSDSAAYRFDADRRAYAAGGKAFLDERYYNNLAASLSKIPVMIIDHRLSPADGPILDLRPSATSIGMPAPAADAVIPGIESGR